MKYETKKKHASVSSRLFLQTEKKILPHGSNQLWRQKSGIVFCVSRIKCSD